MLFGTTILLTAIQFLFHFQKRRVNPQPLGMTTYFQVLNPPLHDASPSAAAVLFAVSAPHGTTLERESDIHKLIPLKYIFKQFNQKSIKNNPKYLKNGSYKHLVIIFFIRECAKTNFQ